MQIGAGRQLPSRCGLGRRPPVLLLVAASPGGGASRGAASRRRRAHRRRAANLPLLRRPRACGQTEWRRVLFCRASESPGGGMDMGRIPPSETYRRASFQADSLGETPICRGYESGAYPPRIRIGYVSDTDTWSPARIGVTEFFYTHFLWAYTDFRWKDLHSKDHPHCQYVKFHERFKYIDPLLEGRSVWQASDNSYFLCFKKDKSF